MRLVFLGLHEGHEVGDRFFHHAGAFDDLREEHFAGAEEVADDVHAVHEGAFDDVEGPGVFLAGFLDVGVDEVDDALDEGVREARLDRLIAPGLVLDGLLPLGLDRLGELQRGARWRPGGG